MNSSFNHIDDARNREWIQKWSAPWAKAGALRVLTISGRFVRFALSLFNTHSLTDFTISSLFTSIVFLMRHQKTSFVSSPSRLSTSLEPLDATPTTAESLPPSFSRSPSPTSLISITSATLKFLSMHTSRYFQSNVYQDSTLTVDIREITSFRRTRMVWES